ncbi:hypothetical protein P3G55_25205, partial [Leptospira sp. 96542]|nr:hypothetical protein [Leptospira sp. 96542]
MVVHTRIQAILAVRGHGVGRHCDDGQLEPAGLPGPGIGRGFGLGTLTYSPYLRTKKTAEILSEELEFQGDLKPAEELAAGNGCTDIISY